MIPPVNDSFTRFLIRDAQEHDWPAMRGVFVQAGRAAWAHILPAEVLDTLSPPERWRPGGGQTAIVAGEAGEVIGFASIRHSMDDDASPAIGEVDALFVRPSVWSHGAGRALLAAATRRLAQHFSEATLWTERRNYRPLRFYQAAGWQLDGVERRRNFRGAELVELRHRIVLRR